MLVLKSFQQITAGMAAKVAAETPITDFTDGSVVLTLLEAAAQEDFNQYVQMLNIIRGYNLDTTEGTDLDNRAQEYGLTRIQPSPHSGFVSITDTRFTKIASKLYAGLPGPIATTLTLNVDDASTFPASGSVYVGRSTVNSEGPIAYSAAPVNNGAYWTITLDVALVNDHGTDETVILAQFGNRTIEAGTEVEIPENDVSDKVLFELNQTIVLLDGENEIDNVLVTALEAGGFRVPANSISAFSNPPFSGATVNNPLPFVNGRDLESDQSLRDRIRDRIQSLSRGTTQSIRTGIVGLLDANTNSTVVSANVVPPVILADGPTKVYIDNGRGLEPEVFAVGLETILTQATGGEQFFQLDNFPVSKASVVSQDIEPFNLSGTETLIFTVGIEEETFTFEDTDFRVPGRARAHEIVEAINNRANLIEARTVTDTEGTRIFIIPVVSANENLQISGDSTAQPFLNFSTLEVLTLKLYKNDVLLTKDGTTASLTSNAEPFDFSTLTEVLTDGDITVTSNSRIITKAAAGSFPFLQYVHAGDYVKFNVDSVSFYAKVRTVVSDLKLILETPYNTGGGGTGNLTVWNSPQLEIAANGDKDQTEVISFGPNDFTVPIQAIADEVVERMTIELNLSDVRLAINNSRVLVSSRLKNSAESKIQALGGYGAVALGYSTVSALSGTLTFTGGGKTVTGSGTAFLIELIEGQWIKANADSNGGWTKIESIESNTVLYLAEGYRGQNRSGVASSRINFSEEAVGSTKDYTLNRSNGQIELVEPLTAGDNLTAGSVNTRAFVLSAQELFDFNAIGPSSTLIVEIDGGKLGTVTTGDAAPPYNTFTDTSLIGLEANLYNGFYLEWTSGNNLGETSFVASYVNTTGQVTTTTGFTNPILIGDKFKLVKVVTFVNASDFADAQNATAQEVTDVINAQLSGGSAIVLENGSLRLQTNLFELGGSIMVIGGTANAALAFPVGKEENQLPNIANVKSQNVDSAEGYTGYSGFTLGPEQTLVMILDDDSVNKTFAIKLQVPGTVTTGGAGAFSDSNVGGDYLENNYFRDFYVYWLTGANEGSVHVVTSYTGTSGAFVVSAAFPAVIGAISIGDTFMLVPRTGENIVKLMNDFTVTTFSIVGASELVGVTGDYIQLSTQLPGSAGKVFVTGGPANGFGLNISSIPVGAPVNDVQVNSKLGLTKGLITKLSVDGTVTTGDSSAPFDTFIDTSMITGTPGVFTGLTIEFLTGANVGFTTTIASYNNVSGQIVLTTGANNIIAIGDRFRISRKAVVVDITGTSAPYTIELNDPANSPIDVTAYTPERFGAIRSLYGLEFETTQIEGIDGYKYFGGLIQLTQWTIDGLDRDLANYPGIGAAGTQFEVLPPVLVKLRITVDVTTEEGVSLTSISGDVANAISEYINSRQVGQDVILSEIIAAAQSVTGVFDVEITNFTENVVIADNELARIESEDLVVG